MTPPNALDRKRRQFTPEEKAVILRRHLADKVPVSDLCDEYHIHPSLFYLWQRQALEHLSAAFPDGRTVRHQAQGRAADRARLAALEAKLAKKDAHAGVPAELHGKPEAIVLYNNLPAILTPGLANDTGLGDGGIVVSISVPP